MATPQLPTPSGTVQAECGCDLVAEWSAFAYRLRDFECRVTSLAESESTAAEPCSGSAVAVPTLNRVECILDNDSDFSLASSQVYKLAEEGWDVWAVVPVARVGEAHLAFVGNAEFIQGWWPRPDGEISFTAPEVP